MRTRHTSECSARERPRQQPHSAPLVARSSANDLPSRSQSLAGRTPVALVAVLDVHLLACPQCTPCAEYDPAIRCDQHRRCRALLGGCSSHVGCAGCRTVQRRVGRAMRHRGRLVVAQVEERHQQHRSPLARCRRERTRPDDALGPCQLLLRRQRRLWMAPRPRGGDSLTCELEMRALRDDRRAQLVGLQLPQLLCRPVAQQRHAFWQGRTVELLRRRRRTGQ